MPREMVQLDRPPLVSAAHDPIPEFQMWVGWNRDMDVQVGIGIPEDSAPGTVPVGLAQSLWSDPGDIFQIGRWLADFARTARPEDLGERVEEGETGFYTYSQSAMERNGRALLAHLDEIKEPFGRSLWWHPTRQAINNLIRLLRKARDAAYGKDE